MRPDVIQKYRCGYRPSVGCGCDCIDFEGYSRDGNTSECFRKTFDFTGFRNFDFRDEFMGICLRTVLLKRENCLHSAKTNDIWHYSFSGNRFLSDLMQMRGYVVSVILILFTLTLQSEVNISFLVERTQFSFSFGMSISLSSELLLHVFHESEKMKQNKIVVVEDETDIRELIEHNLEREGFRVQTASNGEKALQIIRAILPDLVLLDLMIPGIDGIEVCRTLKGDTSTANIPIIMLTAKGEESDIVLGLGIGADDYMTKPFSPKEMLARIKAVLRRGQHQKENKSQVRLVVKDVVIDTNRHEVLVAGVPVVFTATEFKLLHYMASRPGRVFTRSHLLSSVIGEDVFVVERNIDVHVRSVRKKLGNRRGMIETVRGVGYRFRDEIE